MNTNEIAVQNLAKIETEMKNAKLFFATALAVIRDDKLFECEFDSFDSYCKARWGYTRQRAEQIISGGQAVASLPMTMQTLFANHRQNHALAAVPAPQRVAVVQQAAKQGPLTARSIGAAARQLAAPAPELEPQDVAPDADDLIQAAIAAHKMARAEESVLRGVLDRLRAIPERSRVYLCMESIEARLRGAAWEIKHSAPAQYCPFCGGDATCDVCHGTGYVTQAIYDMAPAELKLGTGAK